MQNYSNVTGSTFLRNREMPFTTRSFGSRLNRNARVLVFSREADTCNLLKTFLEMWGYETVVSESLGQSLALIENDSPGLILLDSVLPFATHLDNIRRLRESESAEEIPIIVISGFSQPHYKNLSIEVGADAFFVKPLDFDLLENILRSH
jgi:DNA-binding response OmpR family regulator